MQKYCNIVKKQLNMLIRNMEKNVSAFVVDPKRDFIRKSELSFSKTMRFILGMGSQTLGSELMEFYGLDKNQFQFQLLYREEQRFFHLLFSICFMNSTMHSPKQISSTGTDFMLLMALIYTSQLSLMITALITTPMSIQKATILCI